jgi:hypothetical protein
MIITIMTFVGPWPLTSRSNNCFLNSIYLISGCMNIRQCVTYRNDLRGNLTFWPWGQRSRSHEGHYGMRHTALWSCTHIPNIIDLSRKTTGHNIFVFQDRSMLFGMWVHDHKAVCRLP